MKQTDTTHKALITPFSVLSFFTRYEKFLNNAPPFKGIHHDTA
jgi:hypothetical protein